MTRKSRGRFNSILFFTHQYNKIITGWYTIAKFLIKYHEMGLITFTLT